jgi:cytochrome bd-type quinol oxidase subunit 2
MEEKIMLIKIIGLVIGVLVLGAGIYYLVKEKNDPESKKIYTVVSVIGGVIAAVCAVLLLV